MPEKDARKITEGVSVTSGTVRGDDSQRGDAEKRYVALYHVMRADEDFDTTADILFQLVKDAARKFPGKPRALYLDVEGHRNSAGGFDLDSYEIQKEYLLGFLSRWLTRMSTPLQGTATKPDQEEDIPDNLTFIEGGVSATRDERLRSMAREAGQPIYDSETNEWVDAGGERGKH